MKPVEVIAQTCALAALLAVYALVELPDVTGVAAHEWLGLVLVVVLLAHAVLRSKRLEAGTRRMRAQRVGRIVLDGALLVSLAVCAVSGIMMSGAVLPTFGLFAEGYYLWNPLHAVSAKVLLALLLVHLALNVSTVVKRARRAVRDRGGASDE